MPFCCARLPYPDPEQLVWLTQRIEILVEELSMEAALRVIVPQLIGEATFEVYPHQCKNDLLTNLPNRLRGYVRWLPQEWRIIVVVDRDHDPCKTLKSQLEEIAAASGLRTRRTGGKTIQVVNRLAVEELEAWFFGDWDASRIFSNWIAQD